MKIEKIIDKGTFGQLAKVTAVNHGGRPEKTATATKMLKGKLYLFAKESEKSCTHRLELGMSCEESFAEM